MKNTIKMINLTPHDITFIVGEETTTLPASGIVARCSIDEQPVGTISGVPVVAPVIGEIADLPEPQEDAVYIVSRIVADAAKAQGRTDVYAVGRTLREGSVIKGCLNIVQP